MNKISKYFLIAAGLIICTSVYAQNIDSPYEVGTWQGFRTAAITYTFDDGCSNQFAVALPMFDEFNYKMTLYTVLNWSPNWPKLILASQNGHEVASHTLSHPHLGNLNETQQTAEIKNSKAQIESKIPDKKCLTIAYPYCETGNKSISAQNYMAARICSGAIEKSTPNDFLAISSIMCGSEGSIKTTQDFNNKANSTANSKGWVVYLFHGIDNDGGYSPVTSENLRGSLEYLDQNRNKFWVATFANVACYIKERNNASVKELSSSDSLITVSVTDTLDNTIYNFPITIRRPLPQDWISATVMQNGQLVESQITEVNSVKYIMFDAVPDNGEVSIGKSSVTKVSDLNNIMPVSPELMQNYPNPFNPSSIIRYQIINTQHVSLVVYDLTGKAVKRLVNEMQAPGNYEVNFDGSELSSGIYMYCLNAGDHSSTRKMALIK